MSVYINGVRCQAGGDSKLFYQDRYLFQNGQRFVSLEYAADRVLEANDSAVMAAVRIIESYRPNHLELITAVKALASKNE